MDVKLAELPSRELIPGFHGKLIHSNRLTWAFWDVEEGAEVPEHHHEHEQIMHVVEGRFQFTLDGNTRIYEPGEAVVIPSGKTHSGKALTPCKLMDVFSPARDDYR